MSGNDGPLLYSQPGQKTQLNNEQIQALLTKLSSDEQQELANLMKTCTTEVTMTRGLPITAAVLGSLYFSRQRLPAQYHFGPKGWPFYAIMGIASLTASNLLFMGTCRDRIQPKVDQLWKKYELNMSKTSYDEIRRRNRAGVGVAAPAAGGARAQINETTTKQAEDSFIYGQKENISIIDSNKNPYDFVSTDNSNNFSDSYSQFVPIGGSEFSNSESQKSRRTPPPTTSFDDVSYISGTPSSSTKKDFSFS